MNLPGNDSGSGFGRSIGDAAGKGAILVGIAVLVGVFLLARGFDTGGDAAATADSSTDSGTDDSGDDSGTDDSGGDDAPGSAVPSVVESSPPESADGTVAPTTAPPDGTAHPPNEVNVHVANGAGVTGLAAEVAAILNAENYVATAGNASGDVATSKIYFRPEYGEDAKLIAAILQAPASIILPITDQPETPPDDPQVEAAQVVVILGADGVIAP